jgi:hypothetical protein
MTSDERLAQARIELTTFYSACNGTDAIAALHRLRKVLGVRLVRARGVPETQVVEVEYVELQR